MRGVGGCSKENDTSSPPGPNRPATSFDSFSASGVAGSSAGASSSAGGGEGLLGGGVGVLGSSSLADAGSFSAGSDAMN